MTKSDSSQQLAFILHRRAYRDTSLIAELFTKNEGRVSVVAKGAKRPKSPLRSSLQIFQPLLVSWIGKHDLMTLTQAELQAPFITINEKYLSWAFYINELLFHLLGKYEPYPNLFQHYQQLLQSLTQKNAEQKHLRLFEYDLLARLGYGLQLNIDDHHQPIEADSYYHFLPQQTPVKINDAQDGKCIYKGKSLLALYDNTLNDNEELNDAKRLLRHALKLLLGNKTLKSRELIL